MRRLFKIFKMTGILLAGGKSSRMGKNKAFLELNGKPLIEWNLERLHSIFQEVLISSNEPGLYECYGEKVVYDRFAEHGPLGGLHACLEKAEHEYAFFAACDMPFLQADLIQFMASLTEGQDIVVPEAAGGLHPLFAIYKRSCLPIIENNLKAGRLKIIDFYPQCNVRYVREKELEPFGDPNWLLSNINTPKEWANYLLQAKKG